MKLKTQILLNAILVALLVLNLLWFKQALIGAPVFGVFLLFNSWLLAKSVRHQKWLPNPVWLNSLLIIISVISLMGAVIYYFYQLNAAVIIGILVLITLAALFLSWRLNNLNLPEEKVVDEDIQINSKPDSKEFDRSVLLAAVYLISFEWLLIILWQKQFDFAISSPWKAIGMDFFIYYALATVILILNLCYNRLKSLNLVLLSFHYFLSFGVALIVFKLGYGFDPFIHQATEKAIIENGFILPKPLYYLGQYSLVVMLAQLTQISYQFWDRILLIMLAAA
jgi:hypothetical protein